MLSWIANGCWWAESDGTVPATYSVLFLRTSDTVKHDFGTCQPLLRTGDIVMCHDVDSSHQDIRRLWLMDSPREPGSDRNRATSEWPEVQAMHTSPKCSLEGVCGRRPNHHIEVVGLRQIFQGGRSIKCSRHCY